MMRHLLRVVERRVGPVVGACVLLAGGIAGCVLGGAGTAQAAACPGTPVIAGTTCTDTGTLTFGAGTLSLLSPTALTWAGTGTGLNQLLVDANTAHQSYVVDDATGSGAGWNVTVSATTFTSIAPAATLPNTAAFATNGQIDGRHPARAVRPHRGRGQPISTFSGGMRGDGSTWPPADPTPPLIFLDEPTTGLDPRTARADVGDDPRPRRTGSHGAPHHAVPRRGRPAGGPDRGHRSRPRGRGGYGGRAEVVDGNIDGAAERASTPATLEAARPTSRAGSVDEAAAS